jgi:hypothetical protein
MTGRRTVDCLDLRIGQFDFQSLDVLLEMLEVERAVFNLNIQDRIEEKHTSTFLPPTIGKI